MSMYCIINAAAIFVVYLIPLVISARYYDKKLLYITGASSVVAFVIIWLGNAILGSSLDLNLTRFQPNAELIINTTKSGWMERSVVNLLDRSERIRNNLLIGFSEQLVWFLLYFVAFIGISKSGMLMMKKREELTKQKAYMERDLKLAANIQLSMLSDKFDCYGGENRARIYATMHAARNVGGDFYDFYMLDENHACVVIGDVSGKGMPASLFMVKTLTSLRAHTQMGLRPDEILSRVNNSLNESNKEMMFVTIWLGILDLSTGELEYSVGGHNPPLLANNAGFEYLDQPASILLAAIPDSEYETSCIKLKAGDKLFLYTDGVTESRDSKANLYGEDRLKDFLNTNMSLEPKALIEALKGDLAAYSAACEQFDDITMLCIELI